VKKLSRAELASGIALAGHDVWATGTGHEDKKTDRSPERCAEAAKKRDLPYLESVIDAIREASHQPSDTPAYLAAFEAAITDLRSAGYLVE